MPPTEAALKLPLMLSIRDLQSLMGCGRTVAYARTREPGFPAPHAFSGKSYRWWRHEVLEWVEAHRLTTRPTKPRPAAPARTVASLISDEQLPAPRPVVRRGRQS